MADDELTMTQAAARYGISRDTLIGAARRGHLQARKLGPLWVLRAADVETWREHGKHVPGPLPLARPPKRRPGRPRKSAPPDQSA